MSGGSGSGEPQRSVPTPFLTKTYQLVEDPSVDDLISWNGDGTAFVVWRPAEFARDLLPKYFKHNNFSSFVRQLNTYGFRKVVPDRWEFANDCFKRGEKIQLRDIQRRKISACVTAPAANAQAVTVAPEAPPTAIEISPTDSGVDQVISSCSPPPATSAPGMAEENDRLRRENSQLNLELDRLKNMCGNIYDMMSNYGGHHGEASTNTAAEGGTSDLIQGIAEEVDGGKEAAAEEEEDDETRPMLFGVSIGSKRLKKTGGEWREWVGSEPSDQESGKSNDPPWLDKL